MTDYETAEVVQVLHEKGMRKLAKFLCMDGSVAYGVLENGEIAFLGTKAEAKKVYGNWRKTGGEN